MNRTVKEAVFDLQGQNAGMMNRMSVQYAQLLLEAEEQVLSAVIANITTAAEHFPGVVVLTDRRIFAVCGLPGIRRSISCRLKGLQCEEKPNAVRDKMLFSQGKNAFSLTVDPENGEKFARALAVCRGEEEIFDSVQVRDSHLLNPSVMRNKERARLAKQKAAARRAQSEEIPEIVSEKAASTEAGNAESTEDTALRLSRQLEHAREKKQIDETDPLAVAARLAKELAAGENKNSV